MALSPGRSETVHHGRPVTLVTKTIPLGREQLYAWKVRPIAPRIARQQCDAGNGGMRTNKEIKQNTRTLTARFSVALVALPGEEQRAAWCRFNGQARVYDQFLDVLDAIVFDGEFGEDDLIYRQLIARGGSLQLRKGPQLPNRIVCDDIEQDVGIDEDQTGPTRRV